MTTTKKPKPSTTIKNMGLAGGLTELSELSGQSVQTLNNWYKNKPKLFNLVLKGALFDRQFVMCSHPTLHNVNGMPDKLKCPECNNQNVSLCRGEGWFCNICNAGPFIVTTDGLKLNT